MLSVGILVVVMPSVVVLNVVAPPKKHIPVLGGEPHSIVVINQIGVWPLRF